MGPLHLLRRNTDDSESGSDHTVKGFDTLDSTLAYRRRKRPHSSFQSFVARFDFNETSSEQSEQSNISDLSVFD